MGCRKSSNFVVKLSVCCGSTLTISGHTGVQASRLNSTFLKERIEDYLPEIR